MRIISYVCCIGLLFLPIFSVVFYPGSLNMTVQFMSVKWSTAEGIRQMLLSLSPEKAASPWRWDPFILAQSPCPPLACLLKNVTKAPYRLKVPWSHCSSLAHSSAMHCDLAGSAALYAKHLIRAFVLDAVSSIRAAPEEMFTWLLPTSFRSLLKDHLLRRVLLSNHFTKNIILHHLLSPCTPLFFFLILLSFFFIALMLCYTLFHYFCLEECLTNISWMNE